MQTGNLVLSKGLTTLTKTGVLTLLAPNTTTLSLGDATHEGGDIKVYRDGSGNLQFSVDADAASNATAVDIYGGVVCQNYVSIGGTSLNTSKQLYVTGNAHVTGIITSPNIQITAGGVLATGGGGIQGYANLAALDLDVPLTGTDSANHDVRLQIDSTNIIVARATGDGAGGSINPAIGLYPGTTPTTQAAHIADPAESTAGNNAAIDSILAAL